MRVINYFIFAIIGFLLRGGFMYLVDTSWLNDKVGVKERLLNDKMIRYTDALGVSQQMANNCYDTFNAVAECNKKDGCDLMSYADSLIELNIERKILRQKPERLLDSASTSWLKNLSF